MAKRDSPNLHFTTMESAGERVQVVYALEDRPIIASASVFVTLPIDPDQQPKIAVTLRLWIGYVGAGTDPICVTRVYEFNPDTGKLKTGRYLSVAERQMGMTLQKLRTAGDRVRPLIDDAMRRVAELLGW